MNKLAIAPCHQNPKIRRIASMKFMVQRESNTSTLFVTGRGQLCSNS
jgi:hypothetical protein